MSGKKKEHKLNFLVRKLAGVAGGLPHEGVWVQKFAPSKFRSLPSKPRKNRLCPREVPNFAAMSRTLGGVQKVLVKKMFLLIFRPEHGVDDRGGGRGLLHWGKLIKTSSGPAQIWLKSGSKSGSHYHVVAVRIVLNNVV